MKDMVSRYNKKKKMKNQQNINQNANSQFRRSIKCVLFANSRNQEGLAMLQYCWKALVSDNTFRQLNLKKFQFILESSENALSTVQKQSIRKVFNKEKIKERVQTRSKGKKNAEALDDLLPAFNATALPCQFITGEPLEPPLVPEAACRQRTKM